MGDGGEKLHDWMFNGKNPDEAELFKTAGAVIVGKRTLDLGVEHWGDDPAFHVPVFVLSAESRDTITKEGGTSYVFVTDGAESALTQAREIAGDQDIIVMGGANAAQQYINAGLIDELHIHLVDLLLGDGIKLFDNLTIKPTDLEKIAADGAPGVTHLKFQVNK